MKEKDVRPRVKLDAVTIQKIMEDITYLQLDESDRSYGYTSAKLREYLRVDDINTLLWEKLNEARDDAYDELHTRWGPASYHYKTERSDQNET